MNARFNTPGVKSISRIPVDLSFSFVSISAACGKHKAKYIVDLLKLPKGKMENATRRASFHIIYHMWSAACHMSNLVERPRGIIQQQCSKTLWIISLVNNWEAWWAHHVARRFSVFAGEINILHSITHLNSSSTWRWIVTHKCHQKGSQHMK